MKCKMYVITHKRTPMPQLKDYNPIFVGASIHPDINDYAIRDNEGENISKKNPNYCELTGIYWIWKNTKDDIVGISHYRRFFSKKLLSHNYQDYLEMDEASRILQEKRIILPKVRYSPTSIISAINRAPNMKDVEEMYQALKACSPEYVDDYIWYLRQNKSHLYNMFVMKWNDFSNYCEWLFSILQYIEERHDMSSETDSYRLRLYGFLSERLISVWVHHNMDDAEIKLLHVINTEEGTYKRLRHLLANCKRCLSYKLYQHSKKIAADETLINSIKNK